MTNSDSIDSILADMRQKYLQGSEKVSKNLVGDSVSHEEQEHPALDKILNELKGGLKVDHFPVQANQVEPRHKKSGTSLNPELEHLINHQKKQNQKIIAQKAQQWLDELDPLSGEGIWFADLAKHYPSTLAAAIALLNSESAS